MAEIHFLDEGFQEFTTRNNGIEMGFFRWLKINGERVRLSLDLEAVEDFFQSKPNEDSNLLLDRLNNNEEVILRNITNFVENIESVEDRGRTIKEITINQDNINRLFQN